MPMVFTKVIMMVNQSGRSVFSVEQFSRLLSVSRKTAIDYMYDLVKLGKAERLMRGVITFSKDDFTNATQMIEPSYVSMWSALRYYKIVKQVPAKTFCVTTAKNRDFKKFNFYYHHVSPEIFYGFNKIEYKNTYYNMATLEKAVIDMVYLNMISPDTLREAKKYLNKNRVKELIAGYDGRNAAKIRRVMLGAER